jgi:hypothetical protein
MDPTMTSGFVYVSDRICSMRRFVLLLFLYYVSVVSAKDLPTFDTKSYCSTFSTASFLGMCVEREMKSRDLLSQIIDKVPSADVDHCIKNTPTSYTEVVTCILLDKNYDNAISNNKKIDKRKNKSAVGPETTSPDRSERSSSAKPEINRALADETSEKDPADTTGSIGDAKRPVGVNVQFERNLGVGLTGPDVRELQVFLNANGFRVANDGPGSPGNEVDVFGSDTKRAVIKFQKAHALRATGFFGSATRKYVNGLANARPLSPSGPAIRRDDP